MRRRRVIALSAVALLLLLGALQPVRAHVVDSFRSPTRSMLPTLDVGDHFLVDKRFGELRRGDVVLFRVPPHLSAGNDLRVKRAVALAGDTVELREGALLVNGAPVSSRQVAAGEWEEALDRRSYHVLRRPGGPRSTFGPATVPPGQFFMLGDNRDDNNDSRLYGPIPVEMVVGRATRIWWSRAPESGVRWGRLGQRL